MPRTLIILTQPQSAAAAMLRHYQGASSDVRIFPLFVTPGGSSDSPQDGVLPFDRFTGVNQATEKPHEIGDLLRNIFSTDKVLVL